MNPDYSGSILTLSQQILSYLNLKNQSDKRSVSSPDGPAWLDSCFEALSGKGSTGLVFIIVDGLGDSFLYKRSDSFIFSHRKGSLDSVYPSSTTAALSTFYTGQSPSAHGMLGWFQHFEEWSKVMLGLPLVERNSEWRPDSDLDFSQIIGCDSWANFFESGQFIFPKFISDSIYSGFVTGQFPVYGYSKFEEISEIAKSKSFDLSTSPFIHIYLPELDETCHNSGCNSIEAEHIFRRIDALMESLYTIFSSKGYSMLVTADHGLIDSPAPHRICLSDHPELEEMLRLPVCGEPRAPYLYIKPDLIEKAKEYIENNLSHACDCIHSTVALNQGLFGPGQSHSKLKTRIGDLVLIMKEDYIFYDTLPGEKPYTKLGVHGGLSPEEMHVPVCFMDASM